MLYCRVCAEPFHWFCLDEDPVDREWWTCNRCRTCCVCGHQNKVSQTKAKEGLDCNVVTLTVHQNVTINVK